MDKDKPGKEAMDAAHRVSVCSSEDGPEAIATIIQSAIDAAVAPVEAERAQWQEAAGQATVRAERNEDDVERVQRSLHGLVTIMYLLRDYFDERADAEYLPGEAAPTGNEEARHLYVVDESLLQVNRLLKDTTPIPLRQERDEARAKLAAAEKAAGELWAAAKALQDAEHIYANCDECNGEEMPELCPKCFPYFDDARIARRKAVADHAAYARPNEEGQQ